MQKAAMLLALGLVLAGCSGSGDDSSTSGTSGTSGTGTGTGTSGTGTNPTGTSGTSGTTSGTTTGTQGGTIEISLATADTTLEAFSSALFTIDATFKDASGAAVTPFGISWSVDKKRLKDASGNDPQEPSTEVAAGTSLPGNFTMDLGEQGLLRLTATVEADTFDEQQIQLEVTVAGAGPPPAPFYEKDLESTVSASIPYVYVQDEHTTMFEAGFENSDLNGTTFVFYHYVLPAGLQTIQWTTVGDDTAVDCDLWVKLGDGTWESGTNGETCTEEYSRDLPPAGDLYLVANLWAGANGKISSHVLIK